MMIRGVMFTAVEDDDNEECDVGFRPSLISMLRKVFMLDSGSPQVSWVPEDASPSGVCTSSESLHARLTFSVRPCEPPTALCDWLEKCLGWASMFSVAFLSFSGMEGEQDGVSRDLSADTVFVE